MPYRQSLVFALVASILKLLMTTLEDMSGGVVEEFETRRAWHFIMRRREKVGL
jgi:hypothetical protein